LSIGQLNIHEIITVPHQPKHNRKIVYKYKHTSINSKWIRL